jgi:hypothetical protein
MARSNLIQNSKKVLRKKPRWDDREFLRINLELTEDRPMLFVIQDDLSTVLSHGMLKLRSDGLFERWDEYGEEIFSDFRSRLMTQPMPMCNLFMAIPAEKPEWWTIEPWRGCEYFPGKVTIRATATPFDLEDYI